MNIAVIPARIGSNRIPKKNIKQFFGKPMIAWSIEAALKSGCFQHVIVSTDDPHTASVAEKWGAEAPFLRPAKLSGDFTQTIPVIQHAIDWFFQKSIKIDAVCCIYATAPFISPADIRAGKDKLYDTGCNYVFPVTSYPFPIQRALKINNDGTTNMLHPEHFKTRSQDLEKAFHDAGQFYWGKTRAWVEGTDLFDTASPIFLPKHRVVDIDNLDDWYLAERLFALESHGHLKAQNQDVTATFYPSYSYLNSGESDEF